MDKIATARPAAGGGAPLLRPADAAAAALLAAALGWAYAPNLAGLASIWEHQANYSHGWLVVPIALGFLWHRRDRLDRARVAPSPWGWAALAAVLAARSYLYHRNELWAEDATLPVAVAALALALGGWHLLRWAAPSIAFLWFMLPLPTSLNAFLAFPLQRLATIGSTSALQAIGLPALAEGNVIYVGSHQLEVEQACNGLSMLLTFIALIVAATILIERPIWEKAVLLASAVPIALISNILRIVITACAYHWVGPNAVVVPGWTVGKISHDAAGFAMPPIGLALIWIELRALSWLVIEEDDRRAGPAL